MGDFTPRKRVKICGITRKQDAIVAAQYGADALGFVFYEPSPRNISIEKAAAIIAQLPAFVTTVALFVNPAESFVGEVIKACQIDLLQFHGDESPEFCQQFSRPYIKALRVQPDLQITEQAEKYVSARAVLLDAYVKNVPGGTGKTFDWNLIPENLTLPILLAGGLSPDNVADAVAQPHVWGLDVSGGVEASKGVKSPELIESFIKGANGG
ncbi:MAG: phosphoribosylanthranilate isomerase [Pseudomonadales bacterium]|nr:phosphoribosylanthranilate isomerase [Pseudomonadales bacterium]